MNRLRFHARPEDDWSCSLTAVLSGGKFGGEGRAEFNLDYLRDFATALSAYPLNPEALPAIASGFGESPEALTQTHLSVAFHPHNVRGEIRVTVKLATEIWGTVEDDLACDLSARFLVTYADIDRFVPAFRDMLDGRCGTACLDSSID